MQNFTPISALIGGGLIGLSSAFLLMLSGQVAGVSGMIAGLLPPQKGDAAWRLWFLGGLIVGTGLYRVGTGDGVETLVFDATMPMIVIGGLMTGVGTRVSGGCTSGHGVCGIGRASPRSIVATLTFIAAGVVVVYINRHVLGV
jgi:uncharacterized membrane protein YedE/YeeE